MTISSFAYYQTQAGRTSASNEQSFNERLAMATLGLAGEAGEVVDLVKKHLFHGHPLDKQLLSKELGDVLWYIAETCTVLDLALGDVARENITKLAQRYPHGFSSERSVNRHEDACPKGDAGA